MLLFPGSFTFISDEVSQDVSRVIAFAQRRGITGIELRSMFGKSFRDLTPEDVKQIKSHLADAGLSVHGCATPVFKCGLDDIAAHHEHRDVFRRSVDVALTLGCPLLRVFTFLRKPSPPSHEDVIRIAEHLMSLLDLLPEGLRLGVENEASCLIGTGAESAALLAQLPDPRVGLIWDPCNVLYIPEHRGAATEGFDRLAARVVHIHAKDAARTASGVEARCMGNGDVGWARHIRDLHQFNFQGLVSLETHWRRQALDSDSLHLPGGYQFSFGGEEASELCFDALQRLFIGSAPAP
ncbi:MAG: sugar phosphate isomerase/epimerase [Opitutaceae bacterium]|nr:sugar phosphate isomerase/epimerase [Opitutaceae bacterium]